METGPQLQRLIRQTEGAGNQTWDSWVQDERFIHYTAAPDDVDAAVDDDDDEPIDLIDYLIQTFKPYCT